MMAKKAKKAKKKRKKKGFRPRDAFDKIARNALEFLSSAISDVHKKPRRSVVDFYAAYELILKARLVKEHWSLIFADPRIADRNKLKSGEFLSVSAKEAIRRMAKVVGSCPKGADASCFETIRKHRNRLVHFHNPAYSKNASKAVLQEVVSEQCRAWLQMHRWLTRDWDDEFHSYRTRIARLNRKMVKMREYLKAKYESLKKALERARRSGVVVEACDACGFTARCHRQHRGVVRKAVCRVCERAATWIDIACPHCGSDLRIEPYDLLEGIDCAACEEEVTLDDVANDHGPTRMKDRLYEWRACCGECEHPESVIELDDTNICLVCLTQHEDIDQCAWCCTNVAGLREDSYLLGCPLCDGMDMSRD